MLYDVLLRSLETKAFVKNHIFIQLFTFDSPMKTTTKNQILQTIPRNELDFIGKKT